MDCKGVGVGGKKSSLGGR